MPEGTHRSWTLHALYFYLHPQAHHHTRLRIAGGSRTHHTYSPWSPLCAHSGSEGWDALLGTHRFNLPAALKQPSELHISAGTSQACKLRELPQHTEHNPAPSASTEQPAYPTATHPQRKLGCKTVEACARGEWSCVSLGYLCRHTKRAALAEWLASLTVLP